MSTLVTILKFLPELIALVKWLGERLDEGIDIVILKGKLKGIDRAFDQTDPADAASDLNDVFRGGKL